MDREKQIEEISKIAHDGCLIARENNDCYGIDCLDCAAKILYNVGYRKQSEVEELKESIEYGNEVCKNCQDDKDKGLKQAKKKVAREIFDEIENNYADFLFDGYRNIIVLTEKDYNELKKKYTEE